MQYLDANCDTISSSIIQTVNSIWGELIQAMLVFLASGKSRNNKFEKDGALFKMNWGYIEVYNCT